ncbi:glycosyltransferase family 39 protein [Chryseolinea sp. T2]|uniref:ArnT family glycosyltransferase n=1 Tax=Chryseolinea sp. T2 TaxID=3129255 RepID=UPI00307816AD
MLPTIMRDRNIVSRYAGDIRVWIGLFFLLHLTTITLPPLEPASTWRQTDGLMVARNFYEVDSNIMYPRVDVGGDRTGIVGCEFPFLNYIIYLISLLFGYQHWYGRLVDLIVSSVGVFFLYRLIKEYVDEKTALLTGIIVLCSQWFTYCRTNIPDTFSTSLCIIALYYGIRYLYDGRYYRLAIYLVLGLLGCMNKISVASILTVMAIPFLQKGVALDRKVWIGAASILILGAVFAWYFVWVPHLNETYGFGEHFFMGLPLEEGVRQIIVLWQPTLKRFVVTPFKYSGFVLFLFGLFVMIRGKMRIRLLAFALPFFSYLIVVLKSGYGFQLNPYYVIAFIPPMAFVIATGLASIEKSWIVVVLMLVIAGEGIGNQFHIFSIREPARSMAGIESVLDQYTDRADLIVINGTIGGDPTPMYFAHRKGITIGNAELDDPSYKDRFSKAGIKYVVILPKMYGDVQPALPLVADTGYVRIYRME